MVVKAALVLHKGAITLFVVLNPVAYVSPQLEMLRRAAIELVRECAEQAVAVPDGVGGIEAELA